MHISRSLVKFFTALFIITVATSAFAADPGKLLTGTWQMVTPARDAAGNNCPFVPDTMEFFSDKTMTMSNMPGNRLPFKTDLTPEEKQAMETRDPALKGKNLLLVKPMPQMEWRSTPIVYSYSITKNELHITVTGWTPATFQRVK
jgi:hypothetical protein